LAVELTKPTRKSTEHIGAIAEQLVYRSSSYYEDDKITVYQLTILL